MTTVDQSKAAELLRQACADDILQYLSGVCEEEHLFEITKYDQRLQEQHQRMIHLLGETYNFLDEILLHLGRCMGYPEDISMWSDGTPLYAMQEAVPNLARSQWLRLKAQEAGLWPQ